MAYNRTVCASPLKRFGSSGWLSNTGMSGTVFVVSESSSEPSGAIGKYGNG